jgi:TRAP-type C4-dicarboxylate transport system substrate-binding protein
MVRIGSAEIANISPTYFNAYAAKLMFWRGRMYSKAAIIFLTSLAARLPIRFFSKIESGAGVKLLFPAYMGVRNVTTDNKPIRTPADLNGNEIRCMDSNLCKRYECHGRDRGSIAWSEPIFLPAD